jgi:small conductance mechanosensitive channel
VSLPHDGLAGIGSAAQELPGWLHDNIDTLITVPLQILLVLVVAVVLRLAARHFIDRAVTRMVEKPVKSVRRRFGRGGPPDRAQGQARERRRQRAKTIGSVLRSTATIVIFSVVAG